MKTACPLCGGTGKKIVTIQHEATKKLKLAIQWCLCSKSKFVSENPGYRILAGLGGSYISLDSIDSQLKFDPDNLEKCPNLLIENTDDISFRFHVKGIIMKHGFTIPAPLFFCCDSIEILKKFYVAQDDGSSPSLSDINKFDLVVIILGTNEKNDQLKTCIAQVVYNRLCVRKPTWIYLRVPIGNCVQERSEELEEYLKRFQSITLRNIRMDLPTINSRAKEKAEVSPYSRGDRT
jgi:hypothetical protein